MPTTTCARTKWSTFREHFLAEKTRRKSCEMTSTEGRGRPTGNPSKCRPCHKFVWKSSWKLKLQEKTRGSQLKRLDKPRAPKARERDLNNRCLKPRKNFAAAATSTTGPPRIVCSWAAAGGGRPFLGTLAGLRLPCDLHPPVGVVFMPDANLEHASAQASV